MAFTVQKHHLQGSICSSILAITLAASVAHAQDADGADTIYTGGAILTMDEANPRAEAIAVDDGVIVAVGSEADVMAWQKGNAEVIDLGTRALIPGFVDGHAHVVAGGVQAIGANLLAPPDGVVENIPQMLDLLREYVAENQSTIEKYQIIVGFGYDNATLAEARHPTRDELDTISADIPIYLVHQSGHFGAANSPALAKMGITKDSDSPPGGVIRKTADGEPDGVLEEAAHFANMAKLFDRLDAQAAGAIVKAGVDLWASFGFTTAQEGRATPEVIALLEAAGAAGALSIDVAAYADVLIDREMVKAKYAPTYTNRFRVAGGKLTIDGSPQGFTGWRDRPYYDPVGDYEPGYAGYPAVTREQVLDTMDWVYANDVQLLTHSNGEASHDLMIAALKDAEAKHGAGDRRHVLIHGQFLRRDQVASFDELDIVPSLFPMHTFYWGDWHREQTVGPVDADNISPTGWVLERKMRFTSHTDAPVAFPDTMRVLDATVTRRTRSGDILGAEHRVDVLTALRAMTLWSAYQHFEDDKKGSIEVGKLADLVILSADPTAVDPETLDQLKVMRTIKDGVTIFDRAE
jgi:predicted amidohydrolase YtcJ